MQLNDEDVLNEGFKPLKKAPTEPKLLPSKPHLSRGMSFNEETGEKESTYSMWEAPRGEKFKGKLLDRANSFVGATTAYTGAFQGAVVIVDPISTGAHLAAAIARSGAKCVQVLSIWDSPVANFLQEGVATEFCATIQHDDNNPDEDAATNDTIKALMALPFKITAVLAGAETGVELADRLSHRMKLRSNGEEGSLARRNKYFMGEAVRAAGVRAVKQEVCKNVDDLIRFLDTLPQHPFKCVVKPVQSAGSDDVFLCNDYEEAKIAFKRINGHRNGVGLINDGALVQEFLHGKEYVIDQVSKDGVHKIVCIWQYDKRPTNGAAFVYYGMKLITCDDPKSQEMIAYASRVLDALGINQGPSHMEIMYNDNPPDEGGGPCLVEVGSRCHGGEGTWLPIAEECIGYTMVSITADVYLNGPIFDTLSPTHFPLMKYGMDCDLVSHASGIIRALPGEELIKQLPSYRSVDWEVHVGGFCHLTIDCFTRPGCVQMANASEEDLNRDFARLNYLEDNGLVLDFSIMCASAPTTGSIVVVDPYGAGTDLAAFALKWGYKLILVFTTQGSGDDSCPEKGKTHSHKSQTLLSQHGSHFKPTLMVQHSGDTEAAALANTLSVLKKQSETSPVLAILAGANSAVALVSKLSFALHTRCLGVDRTINICDKDFIQNEISTKTDLTTIKQRVCFSESDVKLFFADSNGAPIVLKSCKNGGGELIMLCHDVDEAVYAFNTIHNDKSVNGVGNNGAIAQEYIEGNEYIIDGVSRDSVIKFTAMWENQKGSINGGDFVPYSMRLVAGPTSEKSFVISEYARKAVQALGITQGPFSLKVIYSDALKKPFLIESSCCCHSGNDTWVSLARSCVGYTQIEVVLNAYVRPDRFDDIPSDLTELRSEGMEVYLLASKSGIVKDITGLDVIRALPSFDRVDMFIQPGSFVSPTVDYYNRLGTVVLIHKDKDQLEKDCKVVRQLEMENKVISFL